ncbi:MAG: response regulator [Anaerolineae bacterium]
MGRRTISEQDVKRHHILVVEDNPSTADMLASYFDSLEYKVSHTAWGQEGLTIATEEVPDLIILDIHLPDIDGYEICSRLRTQRRTQRIPIIFLTERNERMDRIMGLELGAVDYITKPFDIQELRYRVRNILMREDMHTLLHPITELPTSALIEKRIEELKSSTEMMLIGLHMTGMKAFGETYGFVTHDDVLRAVGLILRNTLSEVVEEKQFVGQLDPYKFVIIVPKEQRYLIMGRLHQRLSEALSFFYPHQDLKNGQRSDGNPVPKIGFEMTYLSQEQLPEKIEILKLREALFEGQKP